MKHIIIILSVIICAVSVLAITQRWEFKTDTIRPYYKSHEFIHVDNAGGCVVVFKWVSSSNNVSLTWYDIVWLDKSGKIQYSNTFEDPPQLKYVDKKHMVFFNWADGMPKYFIVNRKGGEELRGYTWPEDLYSTPLKMVSFDSKGYFTIKELESQGAESNKYSVIRYTYK